MDFDADGQSDSLEVAWNAAAFMMKDDTNKYVLKLD
jgi:hypothetical protein